MRRERRITPSENNQVTIQAEIDALCAAGGGRALVLPGEYPTGPLTLRSGVELVLEKGALLWFLDDPALYPPVWTRWEGVECYAYRPMLRCEGARGAAIRGAGVIDGHGRRWWESYRGIREGRLEAKSLPGVDDILGLNQGLPGGSGGGGRETGYLRPPLIQVVDSEEILIEGVTARNSAFWNTQILYSREVHINGVRFENPPDAPNTDGLNIDSSEGVTIHGCVFDVGDDCVGLKSGIGEDGLRVARPTRSVEVRDCEMRHGHGGIVFGSETAGGISDVLISGCAMVGTDRGIRIKSRRGRGGFVEGIRVSEVTMKDVPCPIVVNLFYRCGAEEGELPRLSSQLPQPISDDTPTVRDLLFTSVRAEGITLAAAVFFGLPERPIRGVRMERCRFSVVPGAEPGEPAMDFAGTRMASAGIVTRFVEELSLDDVVVEGAVDEPAIEAAP